ncbi:MAG: zinc-binding dehydrogenase [Gaiellales bacterium]
MIVELKRGGICSTDVAIYDGSYQGRRPLSYPSMLGHEAAGIVVESAPDVNIAPGTRVGLQVVWGNPHSVESLQGRENLDPDWIHIGASALGGTFADRIAMPAEHLVLIPDVVDWDTAALLEPLALAAHAIDLVNVRPGETFVAVGPGPFVLLMIQIARAAGASRVVAIGLAEVDRARLAVARHVGADATVEFSGDADRTVHDVREALGGMGGDTVVDGGGTAESTPLALELAAAGGRVALFGFTRTAEIEPLRQVIRKGLSLYGVSVATRRHYGTALRLIEREAVCPREIVSHRLPVEQVEQGIRLVQQRLASKVILNYGAEEDPAVTSHDGGGPDARIR